MPLIRQLIGEDELDPPGDLREHETFRASCGLEVRPHAAPGHTRGSTLLEVGDETGKVLLTGDVIFRGTIGRTDLPGKEKPFVCIFGMKDDRSEERRRERV